MALERLSSRGIGFETGPKGYSEKRSTLVMVHGAGGRAQIWQNQVHFLNDDVNTLALDLPGHGKTSGPAKRSIDAYAKWLSEILKDVFEAPFLLMGHSMGGAIAQEMAISYSELLSGLVLVATGPRLLVAPPFLEGFLKNFEGTIDSLMGYAYAPQADPAMIREGARMMKEAGGDVVHGDFLACNGFDRRDDLKRIQLPCLITCGEKDLLTPPSLSEKLQESISGSTLKILKGAGHMVMMENYRAFNEAVRDFTREMVR